MMLIDLVNVWKKKTLPEILTESKENKAPFVAQSSFQFETPPQVIFVKDLKTKAKAARYGSLPTISLQSEEQEIYNQTLAQLSVNPKFYNGRQILLTGAVYDTTKHILYLEAVRVDYALIVALEKMKQTRAKNSELQNKYFFKTGVLAPFISKDNKVAIIARNDKWRLRSVAAGFLECNKESSSLTHLTTKTALKEADEEFALEGASNRRRLDFASPPALTSLSFRETIGIEMTPTIEFITPIQVKQDADYVLHVMNHNTAAHAYEHVEGGAINVPLDPDERAAASDFVRQKIPGSFLYGPVLHACAAQKKSGMTVAHRIPEIPESRFYPIGIFKPILHKGLADHSSTEENDRMKNARLCFNKQ